MGAIRPKEYRTPPQRRDKIEKLLTDAKVALDEVIFLLRCEQLHGYLGKAINAFQDVNGCLINYQRYNKHLKDNGR